MCVERLAVSKACFLGSSCPLLLLLLLILQTCSQLLLHRPLQYDPGVAEDVTWVSRFQDIALICPVKRRPNRSPLNQVFILSLKKRLFKVSSGYFENLSNGFSFCFIRGDWAKTLPTVRISGS